VEKGNARTASAVRLRRRRGEAAQRDGGAGGKEEGERCGGSGGVGSERAERGNRSAWVAQWW
jgi:hypothetical protein